MVAKALILRSQMNSPERWSEASGILIMLPRLGASHINISAIVPNPSADDLDCLTVHVVISWDVQLGSSAPHSSFLKDSLTSPPITHDTLGPFFERFRSRRKQDSLVASTFCCRFYFTGTIMPTPHKLLGQ